MSTLHPAVFFDRDDTLVPDSGYMNDAARICLLPGVAEALQRLQRAGYLLVVISNQSGVARGLVTVAQVREIQARLCALLPDVTFAAFEYCFHHPDERCTCRKPGAEMLLRAARRLKIDLTRSVMVGDKAIDVKAGRAAGCRTVLVTTDPAEVARCQPDLVATDLGRAASWIIALPGDVTRS